MIEKILETDYTGVNGQKLFELDMEEVQHQLNTYIDRIEELECKLDDVVDDIFLTNEGDVIEQFENVISLAEVEQLAKGML